MNSNILKTYYEQNVKVTVYKAIDPSNAQRIRNLRNSDFDYINFL
jgi:hypothetical protein